MKVIRICKKIFESIGVLLGINILMLLFMTVVFMIPAEGKVKENAGWSLYTWEDERLSPLFDDTKTFWHDSGSDMILANIAVTKTQTPLRTAIVMPWTQVDYTGEGQAVYQYLIQALYFQDAENSIYAQYSKSWLLIVGILRVLFCIWEISEIRYFFYFLVASLMFVLFYNINRELGWRGIVPLALAMTSRVWLMQSMSLTTMTDIVITLLTMIVILKNYQKDWYKNNQSIIYILIGAMTFAIGFFVAPLVTLGFPLVLSVLLEKQSDKTQRSWLMIAQNTVAWLVGYGGSMLCKLYIAKFAGFQPGTSETALYYLGLEHGIKDRIERIGYCFNGLLMPFNVKGIFFGVITAVLCYMLVRYGKRKYNYFWQLIFISLYPIGWIFIIYEHSKHFWVANIISIFVYAMFSAAVMFINDKSDCIKISREDSHMQ